MSTAYHIGRRSASGPCPARSPPARSPTLTSPWLQAFLAGYGGEDALGAGWRRRAFDVAEALSRHLPAWSRVRTPHDLEEVLWPAP